MRETIRVAVRMLERAFHAAELLVPPGGVERAAPVAEFVDERDRYDDPDMDSYDAGRINYFRLRYLRRRPVDPPEIAVDRDGRVQFDGMHRLAAAVLAERSRLPVVVDAPTSELIRQITTRLARGEPLR